MDKYPDRQTGYHTSVAFPQNNISPRADRQRDSNKINIRNISYSKRNFVNLNQREYLLQATKSLTFQTMRKHFLTFFILFLTAGTSYSQEIRCNDSTFISQQLKAIRQTDQEIRAKVIREMTYKDPVAMKKIALEMKVSDQQNQLFISSLLDKCGWPKGLSILENNTIFLVIDHADTAFMTRYFPLLKTQADLGIVAKNDLATLQDRMMLKRGQKQLFGTQTFKIGNIVTIWPIEDSEGLDTRRRGMGLLPMDDYISLLKKTYQSEVIWDRNLTAETAQEQMRKKN